MAGVTGPGPGADPRLGPVSDFVPAHGGIFGAEAKAQYAAMARLRWSMFRNGLRSRKGALELGARVVSLVIYCILGVLLGTGVGIGSYFLVLNAFYLLPILFWVLMFLWVMITILLASFQEQFDLGILLRFPLRFGSYYLLYIVFGLADPATILGSLCSLGFLAGISAARPSLFLWTAVSLLIFAVFNLLLVRAIFAWIDRWLAQRKTREILGAVFMIAMLSLQLLNPSLWVHRDSSGKSYNQQAKVVREVGNQIKPWINTVNSIQRRFPPGLVADALGSASRHDPAAALESLAFLGLWVFAAGGILAARLRAEFRGENLGSAPARKKTPVKARAVSATHAYTVETRAFETREAAQSSAARMPTTAGSIAAIIEKEFRALLRTMPMLYAIGAPILLMVVFSGAFLQGRGPSGHVFAYALPICVVYAQLGFIQLFYNSLGAEGAGLQVYFLSPTPFRTVMLAKNIFHTILFLLVATVALILTTLRLGQPSLEILVTTIAWLFFSLPTNMAIGIIFSIRLPYRVNPGRLARQRGSQGNALLSLGIQLIVLIVSGGVFALGWFLNQQLISAGLFLVLGVGAIFFWMRVLSNCGAMANARRVDLLATLMKTE
jgi:ABC-2 type transport system permease protein